MIHFIEEIKHDLPIVARQHQFLKRITSLDQTIRIFPADINTPPEMDITFENIEIATQLPLILPQKSVYLPQPFDVPMGGVLKIRLNPAHNTAFDDSKFCLHWELGSSNAQFLPYFLILRYTTEDIGKYVYVDDLIQDIPQGKIFTPYYSYGARAFWKQDVRTPYWAFGDWLEGEECNIIDIDNQLMGGTMLPCDTMFPDFQHHFPYRYYYPEKWHDKIRIRAKLYPANVEYKKYCYWFVFCGTLTPKNYAINFPDKFRLENTPRL